MSSLAPPSSDAQLSFLTKLQRLFSEGDFTATYKFALLIALADLAVEIGADDGNELVLSIRQIAERFIQMYWQHTSPYAAKKNETSGVLAQNIGEQAAVLNSIMEFRKRYGFQSHLKAISHPDYPALISRVAVTVASQPLVYLQNFGGCENPFLYERSGRGRIVLKPGVAYCLRRFHPLVLQLAKTNWISHIKRNKRNHLILGKEDDLEDFLFSTSRQSLILMSNGLKKLDGDKCFYCGNSLIEADVDHFVPFSAYPRDLAHNFVLAHPNCNRSKSDSLAARLHLEQWLLRIEKMSDDLQEIGVNAGIGSDLMTTRQVANWSYSAAYQSTAHAWQARGDYELIDERYLELFM